MPITGEMIISGFISKIISDVVDIPENLIKKAIKDADKKKRDRNQSIETRIYQVTIDAIKEFTQKDYKGQDVLYDAAESIIRGFKNSNSNIEAVRVGLKMLVSQVTSETCVDFLKILQHEICMDENDILYKEVILNQGGQTFETVREGFSESNRNHEETHRKLDYAIEGIDSINKKINGTEKCEIKHYEIPIKNRAGEYADKWDKNVFLNDFDEEDENAGTEIKLSQIYVEECLPNYIWKNNTKSSDKLKNLLEKYVKNNSDRKMLLILGQPGIGKSTLITWIMANLVEKREDILVFQFATDLESIAWQSKNILEGVFSAIGLRNVELENKTLILDGFDEIFAGNARERILNKLNQELKKYNALKTFSLIITCRENYIYNLQNIICDYIVLQAWNETQIDIFCRGYWKKCEKEALEGKIQKILKNKEIFGIPLILYMILALDIDIEKNSSIVDVYDQIFSLKKGGIYDRCYDVEHRINEPETKKCIHQISQRIAFWIFENNDDKAIIYQKKFKEICDKVMSETKDNREDIQSNTLIGSYFKVKHCEGKLADEVNFVHRSIYEYFVATYIFESLYKLKSKEEIAGKLGELLKDGRLSQQILDFIKCKFDNMEGKCLLEIIKEVFDTMLQNGMTYYAKEKYKNVIIRETNIFANMLNVVCLWHDNLGDVDSKISVYLRHNHLTKLNLGGVNLREVNLRAAYLIGANLRGANLSKADLRETKLIGAYLQNANLREADLKEANLKGAYLRDADLKGADLREAILKGANLIGADLRGADLRGVNLKGANLIGVDLGEADLRKTIFDENQISWLWDKYDLSVSKVYLTSAKLTVSYNKYCAGK